MATKRYQPTWEPKDYKSSASEIAALVKSTNESVAKKKTPAVTKSALPTPKAGTINRASGAKVFLPNTPLYKQEMFNSGIKLPTFSLPKAQVPAAKLSLGSTDKESLYNALSRGVKNTSEAIENNPVRKAIANTAPSKFLDRTAESLIDSWDKAAGIKESSIQGDRTDLGTAGNAVADIAGTGIGILGKFPGMGGGSLQSAFTPVGRAAENLATRGLSKAGSNLPGAVGKVANYALPTLAREGAEGALYGGAISLGAGDNMEDSFKEIGKSALENAVFGMGLKGAGDVLNFSIKGVKGKVTGTDGAKVSYVDEAGNEKTMNQAIFKRAAQPEAQAAPVIDTPATSTEPILAGLDSRGATAPIKAETLPDELTASTIDAPAAKQPDIYPDKVNDEVMFKDEQGRLNAGTVSRLNEDGTAEILTPEGNSYRAKKNGDVYEASTSAATEVAAEPAALSHPAMGANNRTYTEQDVVIGGPREKISLGQRLREGASDIYTHVVDINNPIKKVDETTYRLATNSKKVGGTVQAIFNENLVDMEGKPIGESLKAIAEDMPQDVEGKTEFMKYVLQKHNIDRAREGKPVFPEWTSDDSAFRVANLESQNPEWEVLNDRLTGFVNKFMDTWAHKSGLIEDDLWESLNDMYKNYVPTQREFGTLEEGVKGMGGKGFVDQGNTLKKATGSERNIIDPMENIMILVNRTVRTARYNEVGQNLVRAIEADPKSMSKYAEIIPETEMVPNPKFKKEMPEQADPITMKAFTRKTKDGKPWGGVEKPPIVKNALKEFNNEPEFIERKVEINSNDNSIVSVLVNGKKVNVKIKDKNLLESLESVHKNVDLNKAEEKYIKPLNNAFKALITQKNPLFTLTNIARDIPTAYVNGSERNLLKFARDYGSAIKDIRKNSDVAQRYRAMGGEMSNFFSPDDSAKAVADLAKRDNILKRGLKKIEAVNNAAETVPRLAEFKRTLERGGSAQDALYNAGEVTTNFSRGGDITKKADIYAPYLNASVQGIDRTLRQFKNAPIQTVLKGATVVTAPTLILNYVNKDNENYKALDNRTKDTYFLIPTGDTFIKIPKAREIGVLFGSLTERTLRALAGEEDAFKGFKGTAATNFLPVNPLISNLATPAVRNLFANKDFAGRTIVPMSMQGRSPENQYDETTSEIAKGLGDALGWSPKRIDYLIKSYTGIIGQLVLPATTASNYAGGKTSNLLKPVTNKFTADPLYSNQQMNDFYDNVDMLTAIASDYNFENSIDSKAITNAEDMKNSFNKTMKEISELSKQATKSKNPDEARMIRAQMIKLATEANKTLPTTNKKKLEKLLVGIRKEAKK